MTSDGWYKSTIELNAREVAQLFESLDPYPFRDRDLDRDAEAFIVDWARELPGDHALCIVVHLPRAESATPAARALPEAVKHHFAHRADAVSSDLRELFRTGRVASLIGIAVLSACVVTSQLAEAMIGPGPVARVAEESLLILGWVANWRPLEIFLYEWWPISRRRRLFERLSSAEVLIKPA